MLVLALLGLAWLWSRNAPASGSSGSALPPITNNPQVTVEDSLDDAVNSILGTLVPEIASGRLDGVNATLETADASFAITGQRARRCLRTVQPRIGPPVCVLWEV